jgi:hypothetical protein
MAHTKNGSFEDATQRLGQCIFAIYHHGRTGRISEAPTSFAPPTLRLRQAATRRASTDVAASRLKKTSALLFRSDTASDDSIINWHGVFYQTIHAAGMKERKGEMDKRAKDFSPLREIGMWMRFLPIDSFTTDRFRPKGMKEMRAKPLVLGKTPHGAALRLSVEMRAHTQKIRHGAALPPVETFA